MKQLQLDWKKISTVAVEHNLFLNIDRYSEVFKEELGSIYHFEGTLKINGEARPKLCKAGWVP